MRASTTYQDGGSKATKIAIVTALHVGVALALINMKMTAPPPTVVMADPVYQPLPPVKKIEKVEVDTSTKKVEPKIWIPEPPVIPTSTPPDTVVAKVLPPGPVPTGDPVGKDTGIVEGPAKMVATKPSVYTPALANAGDCARPDYPARAVRNGDSGTVTLALLIGVDGKVADYKIKNSSGFKDLDRAAASALSLCKFKPAATNGVAEPAWGQIAYVWSLD
ncbi:MAG: TonB family protein [Pseudomonadota bacterium]